MGFSDLLFRVEWTNLPTAGSFVGTAVQCCAEIRSVVCVKGVTLSANQIKVYDHTGSYSGIGPIALMAKSFEIIALLIDKASSRNGVAKDIFNHLLLIVHHYSDAELDTVLKVFRRRDAIKVKLFAKPYWGEYDPLPNYYVEGESLRNGNIVRALDRVLTLEGQSACESFRPTLLRLALEGESSVASILLCNPSLPRRFRSELNQLLGASAVFRQGENWLQRAFILWTESLDLTQQEKRELKDFGIFAHQEDLVRIREAQSQGKMADIFVQAFLICEKLYKCPIPRIPPLEQLFMAVSSLPLREFIDIIQHLLRTGQRRCIDFFNERQVKDMSFDRLAAEIHALEDPAALSTLLRLCRVVVLGEECLHRRNIYGAIMHSPSQTRVRRAIPILKALVAKGVAIRQPGNSQDELFAEALTNQLSREPLPSDRRKDLEDLLTCWRCRPSNDAISPASLTCLTAKVVANHGGVDSRISEPFRPLLRSGDRLGHFVNIHLSDAWLLS